MDTPGETILIVDDDRTIIRLCQHLLERAGYQVITAMDPVSAIQIMERRKVDLLLSDIRMPVMDGFELIRQAKQYQPNLPVLIMTGYGSIENAIQALHRGVDGLLLKPFENTAELVEAVHRVLEESQQRSDMARLHALRPLFDVTERLQAETSPVLLERLILSSLTGLFQASYAGIFRINRDIYSLESVRETESLSVPLGDTLRRHLFELSDVDNQAVIINANGPASSIELQSFLKEVGWETLLVASVRRDSSQFVFCTCRAKSNLLFTEADLEMFAILARHAAVALENARLYSEQKDYVSRVEDSQRALIQAEKMAAVGRLMASLAHEINNPLQAVRNCLHLAARKGLETQQRLRYLEMTDSELERLVKTVRGMLDFYRTGGAEKHRVDICQIIDQVLALLAPQFKQQGIQVNLEYAGKCVPVVVVPDQIQQVIFNLLMNAMDALDEVKVEDFASANAAGADEARAEAARMIWIDVTKQDGQVLLFIEDSGPGIAPAFRERVFEPFVSTKQHGTGLGLAVSYGIMERHQGSLLLIPPRHATGACFEVILPDETEGENGKDINR